jgi:hypothetical protein
VVCIATAYGVDGRSSIPGYGKRVSLSTASRPTVELAQPPVQRVPGALSLRVKRPGREADCSPPPSVEVKNSGAIPQIA